MLKLSHSKAFWYPVKVSILNEDGQPEQYEFEAKFKRLTQEELRLSTTKDDVETMNENLLGWRGVVDDNGDPLQFGEDTKAAVLSVWPVLPALARAFYEAHSPTGVIKN